MRARFVLTALSMALVVLVAAGPAYALATNNLLFEGGFIGGAGGGNPTQAQIDEIVAANELLLGLAPGSIDLIGKVNMGETATFDPEDPFTADMFQGVTCGSGGTADCKDGLTVTFDFTGLAQEWQIVKILIKADGPTYANGNFVTDSLQGPPPLDNVQAGSISSAEWDKYVAFACGGPNPPGPCPQGAGVSHFLVFGTPLNGTSVPEPATLMLLGFGLVGVGVAARRKIGR